MPDFLQCFAQSFSTLDASSLGALDELYAPDVQFRDPLHSLNGLPALRRYFGQMYASVEDLHYEFHGFDEVGPGRGYLRWTLRFRHPRLGGGEVIRLEGCSYLLWQERVYLHQDYFDAGALLYEHLPLLGRLIAWLKRRLA
ncbi:nuclear transport factor 2 family protein [Metapseudomonas lalkuanensis]|uniref:Nuclear transport factor 2 family protein n=1 Tax=Metapseudomonas lalkuanensis TaxID=2604832 RepID=A0A5J6QMS0_9GAMM|nr:nuclear transport factor 2 family protein [Pseudomonas lalkuanensis]QEY63743.1 nuclear transport factor 2 family protein [Pseudomonas lalkuanensis]UCO96358.1 nuclear transport factor 2 family protein [Pseudomonas lalkuanensis]